MLVFKHMMRTSWIAYPRREDIMKPSSMIKMSGFMPEFIMMKV